MFRPPERGLPTIMPSILNEDDKETVKRHVPKQTNKIQAVAVARLYVAYPNRSKWTYTGLQGAVVLANDLVGNTYWLKMVDISVSRNWDWWCLTPFAFANLESAGKSRSNMGSGDIRHLELQPGPRLLPHIRARGMPGRAVLCGREGGEAVPQEDERQGKERKQIDEGHAVWRVSSQPPQRSQRSQQSSQAWPVRGHLWRT